MTSSLAFTGLFANDKDDFYYGAGFSMHFSQNPSELASTLQNHESHRFPSSFIEGLEAAVEVKRKVQPELHFALI